MSTITRKLPTVARVALGLVFLGSSITALLGVAPQPPLDGAAAAFMGGLAAAGYFVPLLKGTELVIGALLLFGRAVPVALVVAAPIVVQIAAFHLFLAPSGLPVAAVLLAAELYLAWTHRDVFAPLFRRAAPRATAAQTVDRPQLRAA